MRRSRRRILAVGATLGALAFPQAASAQAAPCDPNTPPMLAFRGLPDQLVLGRAHPFGFATQGSYSVGWVDSSVQVAMTEQGAPAPFYTGSIGEFEISDTERQLYIRADPGDAPLTVTASYAEYRLNSYPTPSGQCQRQITKTVTAAEGRAVKRPDVTADSEQAEFVLAPDTDDACLATYAPSPVAVQVKPKRSSRWVTAAAADQCVGFVNVSRNGPGFRLRSDADEGADTLLFEPRTAARNSVKDFNFRVMSAAVADDGRVTLSGSPLRRGILRVTTEHYKAERVHGFKKDGRTNDEYWNYCVNEGKKVWMHNGNPYCIRPGFTYRAVRLRR